MFPDHSTFPFSLLQCFWGLWSYHQAHSCCVAKAPDATIKWLYKFLLLFKQSFQNNLGGREVFHVSDLMLLSYVTKGFPPIHGGQRRHDSRWGDPKPLPGHMSPSLRLAGLSQGTLSPTGETAGEDLPSTSRLSRTQGNSNLGLHKLTGCYGEEPKVAKGRNDSSLRNNECGKIRG